MGDGLYRYPGLLAGSYDCKCGRAEEGAVVLVDSDGDAVCSFCSTPSEALIRSIGFVKLPHPLRVERTAEQPGVGGTDDRRSRGQPPPEPPLGPGGRSLRL